MNHVIRQAAENPEAAFEAAVAAIRAGEVIVLPTDTVYGVAADATNPEAVQRLLDAKGRGRDFPPPVLVAEVPTIRALAEGVDARVENLAAALWPGALTLVLRAHPTLRFDLGDRGATIAVRVPDQDFTRELLRRTGPLAVSSANVHGEPAALTVDAAVEQLGDAVSVYLDAGDGQDAVPSTIVDLTRAHARILREGRVSIDDLNAAVPGLIPPEPTVPDEAVPTMDGTPAADGAGPDGDVPEGGSDTGA